METVIGLLATAMLLMVFFFAITMMSFGDLRRDNQRLEKMNEKIQNKLNKLEYEIFRIDLRK